MCTFLCYSFFGNQMHGYNKERGMQRKSECGRPNPLIFSHHLVIIRTKRIPFRVKIAPIVRVPYIHNVHIIVCCGKIIDSFRMKNGMCLLHSTPFWRTYSHTHSIRVNEQQKKTNDERFFSPLSLLILF